jgi:prepilin-type N-terminal cleavage/methylation domain-containing protein
VHKTEAGFTLVELIITIVVLGVMAGYVGVKSTSAGVFTVLSQSQTMASNIRHAQTLASTIGKSLRITITTGTNGTYSVSCVTTGASPCNTSPMIDPVTGNTFTVTLEKSVSLSGPTTLDIDSLGKPTAAATYVLTSGSASKNVNVAALTGFVSIP